MKPMQRFNPNHVAGGPGGGEFTSAGGGGEAPDKDKQALAKASYKPMTKLKEKIASESEDRVAEAIGGVKTPDNKPFDVLHEKHGIEIKTVIEAKNPKITMHKESLARKVKEARALKIKTHTVVCDRRGGQTTWYYKRGLGSFRLSQMRKLSGLEELKTLLK